MFHAGALKTKDVFLGVVSHEIRTPLPDYSGVSVSVGTDGAGKGTEGISGCDEGRVLPSPAACESSLDASRLAAGQSQIQEEAFEVTDFIRELRNSFSRQAEKRDCIFPSGGVRMYRMSCGGDLMKIRQIAGNLITNGLKFTEKGRVTVNLGWEERAGEQFLLIKVRDSGIGIREEDRNGF